MRTRKISILLGIVAALTLTGVAVTDVGCARKENREAAAVYYCPMHPTYTSDKPATCPICNMNLVPREEPATAPSDTVTAATRDSPQDICVLHNCPMLKRGESCPMLVIGKDGEELHCPACESSVLDASAAPAGKKILYWTDPMIPGYKSDAPGTSPMGMELVPVYEEPSPMAPMAVSPKGYASILLTPQKRQFIGVKTAVAERRRMTQTIRTVGKIAYDPELYQAQEEFLQALRSHKESGRSSIPEVAERAERLVASSRMRLRLLGLSEELIEEIAERKESDRSLLLSGDHAWLYATIYEFELPLVKVGQMVEAELPALPGNKLVGTIRSIDPVLDPGTRSARVRAVLKNLEGILKPEMFVNVTLAVEFGRVVAVPDAAVFDTGTNKIVFVDKGDGLFEPREVATGVRAGGYWEIKSGIRPGESVVTSGNFLIDSESRLKAALEELAGEERDHTH